MGDHQHGTGLLTGKTLEQFHNFPTRAAVERRCRLIRKQQLRPGRQRTGDGHSLLLTTRKILRKLAEVILQANGTQPFPGLITASAVTESLKQISAHLHVLFGRETAEKVMALKNHADPASQLLSLSPPGAAELPAKHAHISLLNLTKCADQRQKRGFATP